MMKYNIATMPKQSHLAAALLVRIRQIRQALTTQSGLDALATSRAGVLPLLLDLGHDIWNPQVFRHSGSPSERFIRYILETDDTQLTLDVWAVSTDLKKAPALNTLPESPMVGLKTNGGQWQIIDFSDDAQVLEFSLFESNSAHVLSNLLAAGSKLSLAQRLNTVTLSLNTRMLDQKITDLVDKVGLDVLKEQAGDDPEGVVEMLVEHKLLDKNSGLDPADKVVKEAVERNLKATQLGMVRPAAPLSGISLGDVKKHANANKALKGYLQASFDTEPVNITSRSAFYVVLATLALQHGREDLIPEAHLVRPADGAPDKKKVRALGQPGWFLNIELEPEALEDGVVRLLDGLNLWRRFYVTHRGERFPQPPA